MTDAAGEPLGTIPELDMSSGNSLATAGEVWSTCLHFDGSYTDAEGRKQSLNVTESYGLRVRMYGPLAAADVALGLPRPMTEVCMGSLPGRRGHCVRGGDGFVAGLTDVAYMMLETQWKGTASCITQKYKDTCGRG